jgi:hypothetical protein
MLPSILAAVSLIATVASASLVAAAECQFTKEGGTIQGMTAWKGTTSSALPRTITEERDIYGGLVPSPVLEIAPYMNSNRIVRDNRENQEVVTIGACLSQDIRESALFNQAMIIPIGKTQAKAHTQIMKFSALSYNGKRQVRTIRTTPPEIRVSSRDKAPTIIGPVQEIQKPILSDERSVSQAVAMLPTAVESLTLSGGQPFVALNQLQNALQPPGNESLRMNQATMLALDNRNCVSGCP